MKFGWCEGKLQSEGWVGGACLVPRLLASIRNVQVRSALLSFSRMLCIAGNEINFARV